MDIELIFIIIVVLLELLLVSGLIFFILKEVKSKKEYKKLKDKYELLNEKYKNIEWNYVKIKQERDNYKRSNDELNMLIDRKFVQVPKQEQRAKVTVPVTADNSQSESISIKEPPVVPVKDVVMYASFPRSAGNNIYFSDLTGHIVEDSFFELKISKENGKASYKPLDFMKIRNYDPAMVAMLTEGVKPNVASTVLAIEPGLVHVEGKDWIIDKPAKIKLA